LDASNHSHLYFEDVLNVLSCFAVVALHCSLTVFGQGRGHEWNIALVQQAVCIFAVPVFMMLSGANLMGYRSRYTTGEFFRKRVLRVGVALLVGSVACYLAYGLFPDSFWGARDVVKDFSLREFVHGFLGNTINNTYWFFYAIIGVYCVTPLLSLAADRPRLLRGLLVGGFLLAFVVPTLTWAHLVRPEDVSAVQGWPLLTSTSVFYFLLGYYLREYVQDTTAVRVGAVVAMVASPVLMYAIGHAVNVASPQYDSFPVNAFFPLAATYAAGLFCVVRILEPRLRALGRRAKGVLATLSSASLYVYLFHIPVINWLGVNVTPELSARFVRHPLYEAVIVFVMVGVPSVAYASAKRAAKRRAKDSAAAR
jgi:surface polysaccharide O-acyltransferase-like enzyme